MCGIVGFIGQEQAAPILLDGLAHLEYRGYDSAGVAVISAQGKLQVEKAVGLPRSSANRSTAARTSRAASASVIPAGRRTARRTSSTLTPT